MWCFLCLFFQGLNTFNRIKFMVSATEILSTSALNQPLSKFLLCEATTVYKAFHAWAGLHQQSFLHRQCRSTSGNAENS